MFQRLVLLSSVSILLTACSPSHEGKSADLPRASFGADATLGFEVVKVVMARNRCNECHTAEKGNRGGLNLETYANTKAVAASFLSEIQSGGMPMGGPAVSPADIDIIAAWVAAGAPEVSDLPLPGVVATPAPTPITDPVVTPTPVPTPIPDPVVPTPIPDPVVPTPTPEEKLDFAAVSAKIFAPHCVQCHKGFATYAKVALRLSEIQTAVDTNEMPKDASPLPIELKRMLADWIAAGAPETVN